MPRSRPTRAYVLLVLTSVVIILSLIFLSSYNYGSGSGSVSQPQIKPPSHQALPQSHGNPKHQAKPQPQNKPKPQEKPKPESTVQSEPQAIFGSDMDPDHCVPTTLPFAKAKLSSDGSNDTIPNIVHYVWLLNGNDKFSVDFKVFTSVYSASVYFQPDTIYIHTDASPEQWEKAKSGGNEATRWMLSIPNIRHNWIKPPKYTLSCVQIRRIEHVSDFIRTQQLYNHGGIYLDTDAFAVRDVHKLRESGFSNIVGIEDPGKVNNGVMICQPKSALLAVFMSEQHRVFDNEWLTHSIELLSKVAYRLQAAPGEALILGPKAFAPSSWRVEAVEALFNPHDETKASVPSKKKGELPKIPSGFQETVDYWTDRNWEGKAQWEEDFSASYVIHAFKGVTDLYWPKQVTLEYVLARQSNLARAVYPAIKHAIDVGIIDRKIKTS